MKIARVVISSAAFCAVDIVRGGNRLINVRLLGLVWLGHVGSNMSKVPCLYAVF